MITLRLNIIDEIIKHAETQKPIEACGYLAGINGIVSKAYLLTNIDNSPEHFSFDAEEQFNAIRNARASGLEILCNFHSHPATPARPSVEDIRLAYDPDISYLIISLMKDKPDIKSFKIRNGEVEVEEIKIIN